MKLITIQIQDSQMVDALDGVADARYKELINGKPNPQSREDFAKEIIKSDVTRYLASLYCNWITTGMQLKAAEVAKSQFVVTVE